MKRKCPQQKSGEYTAPGRRVCLGNIFVLTQHLSVIVAHIPLDHWSISFFMILKLVLWHWMGILQVHIQNLRFNTEGNVQVIHYQRCIHQYFQKEKKQFTVMVDT